MNSAVVKNAFWGLGELMTKERKVTVIFRRSDSHPITGYIRHLDGVAECHHDARTFESESHYTAGVTGFILRVPTSLGKTATDVWINLDAVEQIRPFDAPPEEQERA